MQKRNTPSKVGLWYLKPNELPSNVKPEIPTSFLEEIIKKLNIRIKSRVTHVRAGFVEAGYNYILSFRRQFYIDPQDEDKIPPAINIKTENSVEWAYFS